MSLFWQEERAEHEAPPRSEWVDLAFAVRCRALPVDHALALSEAVRAVLPWLGEEPGEGVHTIHGAESGNGWQRPEDPDTGLIYLSRRARLTLRLPRARVEAARALTGRRLEVLGETVEVGEPRERELSPLATIFSRYVLCEPGEEDDEPRFLARVAGELSAMGVGVRKALCGRAHPIRTPEGRRLARSLMLADLEPEESLRVQERGVGTGRVMGCGLFLPHKGIRPVRQAAGRGAP